MADAYAIPDDPALLAYMAGIIDGEGSICVFPTYGSNYKYGKYPRYKSCLSVSNTSIDLLKWIATRFGGKPQLVKRSRDEDGRWKPTYHWALSYEKAATIVLAIRPYLVVKRRQADLFLEFQATAKRTGKPTPAFVQERRHRIAGELKALNKRGPDHAVDTKQRAGSTHSQG